MAGRSNCRVRVLWKPCKITRVTFTFAKRLRSEPKDAKLTVAFNSIMSITFTEDQISQKLHEAIESADPASDGFQEIELTEETSLKCAAVLVPLVWHDDEWHLLFTRRTDVVESHKGQVSFPGGACDEGETMPEETALREAEEEIGIHPDNVRVLGRLSNLVTITYFRVTPVVGVVQWPAVFRVGAYEVARIFTIPLAWLANPANRW